MLNAVIYMQKMAGEKFPPTGTARMAIAQKTKPRAASHFSRPFLKDRRRFGQLVDPLLQGCFPVRSLHHAIAITAMCLQEQPTFRPLIGDIVVALEYLSSQTYSSASHKGGIRSPSSTSPSQPARHIFS
ncbi:hypothetical protein L1049_025736 [Liquidambar formosana]|uniref:Serine/threonine protein kinase n=1 Tax=Liquidambar formosana TaxID=63359 RepID=A0AAP0NBU2_LIQFO